MEELIKQIPVPEFWQIFVASAIVIASTLLAVWIVRGLLYVVGHRLAARTKNDLDDRLLAAGRKYVYQLVYLLGAVLLFNILEKGTTDWGPVVFHNLDGILYLIAVFVVAQLIVKVSTAGLEWYGTNIAKNTESKVDDEFIPLLDRAIKIIVYVLALLIALDHYDVDIKGLIAVLGVGSLAIALAAKETIANMIGGFVIMIDRPFRIDDRVRLDDGTVCRVRSIGIRSTKFWTFDNTLIIVPNAELMKSTVHNITYPFPQVRVRIDVGVGYDSDLDQVRDIMLSVADDHEKVLADPGPSFYFLNFGDSSLDVTLRCHVADVSEGFATASQLREGILKSFRNENVEIPFPQRVITMVGDNQEKISDKDPVPTSQHKTRHHEPGSIDIDDDN